MIIFQIKTLSFLLNYFNPCLLLFTIINTNNNKNKIKKLIKIYLKLGNGVLIHSHNELICISLKHSIYISRRSLKHFVERRKAELLVRYTLNEMIDRLYFVINCIEDVYKNKDSFEINELGRTIYTKNYNNLDRSSIRIVFEPKKGMHEIVSMHFKKNKKLP